MSIIGDWNLGIICDLVLEIWDFWYRIFFFDQIDLFYPVARLKPDTRHLTPITHFNTEPALQ
jgi:hypothetical protein